MRKNNERRNNLWIYKLYPGFHHKVGTAMAVKENAKLTKVTKSNKYNVAAYVQGKDFIKNKKKP